MNALPKPITIKMVDFSLARLMATDKTLQGTYLSLATPTAFAETQQDKPVVNVFLYRIREEVQRRQAGTVRLDGRDVAEPRSIEPPRYAELTYMISVNSHRAEAADPEGILLTEAGLTEKHLSMDIHVPYQSLLMLFTSTYRLPLYDPDDSEHSGSAYPYGISALLRLNQPPEDARSAGELWTALQVRPRPFLDLSVIIPLLPAESGITQGKRFTRANLDFTPSVPGTGKPSEQRALTTVQLPPPSWGDAEVHREQRKISVVGKIPAPATGVRAWICDEKNVHLSDMTVSMTPTNGPDMAFTAAGWYPTADRTYTLHAVAVGDGLAVDGRVLIDSMEMTQQVVTGAKA
ncbi:Pvc16 family protein [Kitasatospora sp. NPDC058048]|uniref:Pvc16 family protein n=1 Tax=Kitasatospora sp. NPDC058048 TaxID=3346313 RepID=UPI0036DD4EB1